MSKCSNCLSEKVCRYNDGHNLYCKDTYDCPHFKDHSEWVHLPCKAGDTVWYITGIGHNLIKPAVVKEIIIDGKGIKYLYVCGNGYNFEKSFNIFYLTREEAEKALEGRK